MATVVPNLCSMSSHHDRRLFSTSWYNIVSILLRPSPYTTGGSSSKLIRTVLTSLSSHLHRLIYLRHLRLFSVSIHHLGNPTTREFCYEEDCDQKHVTSYLPHSDMTLQLWSTAVTVEQCRFSHFHG
ncbi:unnamed protein product [Heterobilharzia americana]|nr:unnamed protein product [Heterobilharzia americana]